MVLGLLGFLLSGSFVFGCSCVCGVEGFFGFFLVDVVIFRILI